MDQQQRRAMEDEFSRLWDRHAAVVWAYAARRVGRDRADDVVAEVFSALWRSRPGPVRSERAWVLGVARNHVRRLLGTEDRQIKVAARAAASRQSVLDSTEEEVSATMAAEEFLESAGPADQELLRLLAWEQLTIRQAAQVLGIRPAAARMRLTRLRRSFDRPVAGGLQSAVAHDGEDTR